MIRHLASQNVHEIGDVGIRHPAVPASLILLHLKASVIAALPVDDQIELFSRYVDNDLADQQTDDFLARLNAHAGAVPGTRQILAQYQ